MEISSVIGGPLERGSTLVDNCSLHTRKTFLVVRIQVNTLTQHASQQHHGRLSI